jgi:hypothetical protein
MNIYYVNINGNIKNKDVLPRYKILQRRQVVPNRRVERLVAVPYLRRLVVFCGEFSPVETLMVCITYHGCLDSMLSFYSLPALQLYPRELAEPIRGVTSFYVDTQIEESNGTASMRLYVGKRRHIQYWRFTNELIQVKAMDVGECAVAMCYNAESICYADTERYHILDMRGNVSSPIVDLAHQRTQRVSSAFRPLIAAVGDSEFIIATMSSNIL